MAAAVRPGSPDARDARDPRAANDGRVPCPLCGGLIHPLAGKCKHCKADQTGYRSARPAANAPLPALNLVAPAHAHVNGQPVHAPIAHAVPMPPSAYDARQPVLPPRPTAHVPIPPAPSAWRTWPIFVIAVATMAIVAAVVLKLWPVHSHDGKRALQPPPAPERMDTQAPAITPKAEPPPPAQPPQAPQGSVDPWGTPPPAPHDPSAAQIDPPAPPAAADPDDQVLDVNPFATAQGPSGRRRGLLNGNGMMARAMAAHLCRKLVQCGSDEPLLTSACDGFSHLPDPTLPSCPAALRCLRDIDTMDCASPSSAIQATRQLMQFSDCIDASRC